MGEAGRARRGSRPRRQAVQGQPLSDWAQGEDDQALGEAEEAANLGGDTEDLPAAGPLPGGAQAALEAGAGEGQGDTEEVGGAGGDCGGEEAISGAAFHHPTAAE